MKKLVRWIVVLLIIAGAAVLIWQKTRPKPLELVVKAVVRGTVEKTVANTRAGTVNACRRAKLSPSLGGQVALLPIRGRGFVKAGELLLEIWNEDLKAQLVLSEREVAVAEAKANAVCLSADEAGRQAHRAEILFKQRIVSEEHTDQAVTKAKSLRAECTAARASVEMRQAQVEVARVNLSRTRLIAPFDGVIAEIEGELNEYITPSPVGVLTPPAVDLIENSCYYVSAPIDEVDAAEVRVGMEVRITLDAFRNRSFSGQVRRIAPYVLDLEKQARTVEIEVSFDIVKRFPSCWQDTVPMSRLVIDVRQNSLKIPTEAVMEEASVFVFSPGDHHVQKRTISTGLSNWAATEVVNGLAEGELIVVNVDKPGLEDGVEAVRVEERQ